MRRPGAPGRWDDPAPGEREAGERTWPVVRAAYEQREPLPAPRRDLRPVLALAAVLAVVAAALSPPGIAVLRSLRKAISVEAGPKHPLVSLPAPGRLLVNSPAGAWVVQRDGSKRLLSGYRDASWSPHGKFLVAARHREVVALEAGGKVHWSIARRLPIGAPAWSSEQLCCRIAYAAGDSLRLVAGNGTGDRLLVPHVSVTPVPLFTWRPGTRELAYVDRRGRIRVLDVERGSLLWTSGGRIVRPELLAWSDDGLRLLAVGSGTLTVFRPDGRPIGAGITVGGTPTGAAFVPRSHRFALSLAAGGRSVVRLLDADQPGRPGRRVYSAQGTFGGIVWSPNGRRLLVAWTSADEWLFVRPASVQRATTVSDVAQTFETSPEAPPAVAGWTYP